MIYNLVAGTDLQLVRLLENVCCYDVVSDSVLCTKISSGRAILAIVRFDATRKDFTLELLDFKRFVQEDSDSSALNSVLVSVGEPILNGDWVIELLDGTHNESSVEKNSDFRGSCFTFEKFAAEISVQQVGSLARNQLAECCLALRTNHQDLLVYRFEFGTNGRPQLCRVLHQLVTTIKFDLSNKQDPKSIDLQKLSLLCQPQLMKLENFHELSGLLFHNRLSNELFAVLGSRGRVSLAKIHHPAHFSFATVGKGTKDIPNSVVFVNRTGRLFMVDRFFGSFSQLGQNGRVSVQIPVGATVSKVCFFTSHFTLLFSLIHAFSFKVSNKECFCALLLRMKQKKRWI